jgi:hypothetical protein
MLQRKTGDSTETDYTSIRAKQLWKVEHYPSSCRAKHAIKTGNVDVHQADESVDLGGFHHLYMEETPNTA